MTEGDRVYHKVFPSTGIVDELTTGFLISYRDFCHQFIISSRLKLPYGSPKNMLAIYAIESNFTRITSYPIMESCVWKMKLQITKVQQGSIEEIGRLLKSFKQIHSTGVCQARGKILIENYYLPCDSWDKAVEIISQARSIPNITDCVIAQIND